MSRARKRHKAAGRLTLFRGRSYHTRSRVVWGFGVTTRQGAHSMNKCLVRTMFALPLLIASIATGAAADDVRGADVLLCSVSDVTSCGMYGDCFVGEPDDWNIPRFVEVDLQGKRLRTTKASGQDRSTAIKHMERIEGTIFLQGIENGRAFSLVIVEETGELSAAVVRPGIGVSAFGACTPWPGTR